MGPDSTPRNVIDLHRGRQQMYELKPLDHSGHTYVVNEDHYLALQYCASDGRYGLRKGDTVEVTVREYLTWSKRKRRLFYGFRKAAEYPSKPCHVDPYVLGCWLGDGHSRNAALTTMDPEVRLPWILSGKAIGANIRYEYGSAGRATTYWLVRKDYGRNPFYVLLEKYNLIGNKHIPKDYLLNDRKNRLELLAGLMDTDGHLYSCEDRCPAFEIVQVNKRLANDIASLARSLGFKVSRGERKIKGKVYYRMTVLGKVEEIPTRIPRKQAQPWPCRQRAPMRFMFDVTKLGVEPFYGFELDGDHRFFGEDYTVLRNSGKTAGAVNEAVWGAEGYNPVLKSFTPVPSKTIIVLDDPEKVEDVWLPEARKWFNSEKWTTHKHGRTYISEIVFPNGSNIRFMFHGQEELKFESIEADYVIFDEPPPRHIWIALRRGGRKRHRQARYLFIGTPLSGSWMRTELFEPWINKERDDIECFKFGTEVNKENLSDDYIESFSRNLTEKERRIRLHGDFFDLEGLALNHIFKRETHIVSRETVPPLSAAVCAIDPHPNKKHVAMILACDEHGYLYYVDEIASNSPPREFARELKRFYQPYPMFDIVCDSLGAQALTGGDGNLSFIEVLQQEGIRVRTTTWEEKKDDSFIMRVQDVLGIPEKPNNMGLRTPKLRIREGNWGIIGDIEQVSWIKVRREDSYKPKLDIESRDHLACLKYALACGLHPKKKKSQAYVPKRFPSSYGIRSSNQRQEQGRKAMIRRFSVANRRNTRRS